MGADNRGDLKLLSVILGAALAAVVILALLLMPLGREAVALLDAGVGLKAAALWGFGTTVALLILFALVAGDGLLGELQFMLGAFFLFFVLITLLIAWIF